MLDAITQQLRGRKRFRVARQLHRDGTRHTRYLRQCASDAIASFAGRR